MTWEGISPDCNNEYEYVKDPKTGKPIEFLQYRYAEKAQKRLGGFIEKVGQTWRLFR